MYFKVKSTLCCDQVFFHITKCDIQLSPFYYTGETSIPIQEHAPASAERDMSA